MYYRVFIYLQKIENLQKELDDEEYELSLIYNGENDVFNVLKSNLELCDFHPPVDLIGAKDIIGSKAYFVARSQTMKCVAFVHGIGLHSCGDPKLSLVVRELLSKLAVKLNCIFKCGEDLFSFITYKNSGISYFMNQSYYDYFWKSKSNIRWTRDVVRFFQDQHKFIKPGDLDFK